MAPGHPLHTPAPGILPSAAIQLAQVQANISNGQPTWSRLFELWTTDRQLHTAAVPSNAGHRIVSLHERAFHLHELCVSSTAAEQELLKPVWALPIPEHWDSTGIHNSCRLTWSSDDQAIAVALTLYDYTDLIFSTKVYVMDVPSGTMQALSSGPVSSASGVAEGFQDWLDIAFSADGQLIVVQCHDPGSVISPLVYVFARHSLQRLHLCHSPSRHYSGSVALLPHSVIAFAADEGIVLMHATGQQIKTLVSEHDRVPVREVRSFVAFSQATEQLMLFRSNTDVAYLSVFQQDKDVKDWQLVQYICFGDYAERWDDDAYIAPVTTKLLISPYHIIVVASALPSKNFQSSTQGRAFLLINGIPHLRNDTSGQTFECRTNQPGAGFNFSPDGRWVALMDLATLSVHDVKTGSQVIACTVEAMNHRNHPHPHPVSNIFWAADCSWLGVHVCSSISTSRQEQLHILHFAE